MNNYYLKLVFVNVDIIKVQVFLDMFYGITLIGRLAINFILSEREGFRTTSMLINIVADGQKC